MEVMMEKWVTDFFLRRLQNPRAYSTTLFSSLKPDDSVQLKITAVLRDISNWLIHGRIDEELLDLLEILEKLQEENSVVMGSLKSAYCWTAVECTLRFMWPETASDGFFSDAIERIWKNRIGILKERKSDLVSRELLKWESDLKIAFEEPEMYQKIRETNIRYNAISYLDQLLKEQWALLGCSSLESEARKRFLDPIRCENFGRADSIEREDRNGNCRDEANKNPDGVDDKVNEQEQVEQHEASLNKGDITVARELKECLLEIQGMLDHGKETNNVIDHSNVVSRTPDRGNRTETGGGQGEGSKGTSSSSSSERVRPHLPTPEPMNVSPLKKGKSRPRRAVKFWTHEEVEALREGVKQYGRSWKDIKNSNPLVLADRTEVDLKDKWRNLIGRQK